MQIRIRTYQTTDYPTVKAILEEADMSDPTWDSENNYASMIQKDPSSVLVALVDNNIVGIIIIDFHGNELSFLYRLAVKKEYRKRGIGTKLLEEAEKIVKERGGKEVAFFVDANNEELQEYYAKKGYTTSGNKFICMWKSIK